VSDPDQTLDVIDDVLADRNGTTDSATWMALAEQRAALSLTAALSPRPLEMLHGLSGPLQGTQDSARRRTQHYR
jgi:hypothetical protein